ncbi:MAG: T9SS type A sorting domain-containing protein, partial [Chitinophagales bacterium]
YVRVYGYNGAFSTSQCYKLRINARSSAWRLEQPMSNANKDELINSIVAIPNPSSTQTTFEFLADMPGTALIKIADMTGRIVYNSNYEVEEGINNWNMDVSDFKNGMYMIMMNLPGEQRVNRFIVQH